ncbi:MAG: hypothetical protein Q7V19_05235 [Bacteroidales bacterium]|jgi:hypothetical protein|nr:hypothetical protein [Bacteroidales bacterium]MDP2237552.1 hypothetical protein [Bacteroidales bacterium]
MTNDLTLGIGSRVNHSQYGKGVVIQVYADAYEITFIDFGTKTILRSFAGLEVLDYVGGDTDLLSFEKVERIFTKIIRKFSDIQENVPMGTKWNGGIMTLQPGDRNLKPKEVPIEAFFHKIVMVRDRLRVMEQRINSSDLTDEEKVNLQQYLTRIYGSLTTFNVLFADKEDYFVGDQK